MLDEAEHLEKIDGSWSFIRSVFSRLTENDINYLIIVAGKLGLFSKIKEIFLPMERFFYPWELEPLTKKEVEDALIIPFHKYEKNLTQEVTDVIYELSQGFPFIVQVFGFHLFGSDHVLITKKILDEQLQDIMNRLDVQVFKTRYESAGPQELIILKVISEDPLKKHTAKELNKITKIKSNRITNILISLVMKSCLKKTGYGEYMIFHPLFAEYVKRR